MTNLPDLHASYYTLAGIRPMAASDVSRYDLRARIEAAARVGYKGIGITHADLNASVTRYGYAGIKSLLEDNGLVYFELEPIMNWFASGAAKRDSESVTRDFMRAAEKIGVHHVKAIGALDGASYPVEVMREAFHALCAQAESAGTKIAIEIVCISNIKDVSTALGVLGDTHLRNGGLALDIWHFVRGPIPFADIAAIPLSAITWVELDDGDAQQRGDMLEEQIDRRRLCGTGGFDIAGFLSRISQTGYRGPFGVEILSEELRSMSLEAAATATFASARGQFEKNWP